MPLVMFPADAPIRADGLEPHGAALADARFVRQRHPGDDGMETALCPNQPDPVDGTKRSLDAGMAALRVKPSPPVIVRPVGPLRCEPSPLRRRAGVTADRGDERLQLGIAEELHERVSVLPLVDDQCEPVAASEPMVQRSLGFRFLRDLRKRIAAPSVRRLQADFARNNTHDMRQGLQAYLRWLHRDDDSARRLCEAGAPAWIVHAEKGDRGLTQLERAVLEACPEFGS